MRTRRPFALGAFTALCALAASLPPGPLPGAGREAAAAEPPPNVKVEVRIVDRETGREAEVGATGQLLLSFPEASAGGEVFFRVDGSRSSRSSKATQFVLVASGAEASIAVGRDIPFETWFYTYGREKGLLAKGIDWREVGTRLSVRPTVLEGGRKIRLRAVPQVEYLDEPAGRARGKGRGRRETISFIDAATEVVVESGREVRVGGTESEEEFYDRFLVGYDRQRRVRSIDIFLRATVAAGGP